MSFWPTYLQFITILELLKSHNIFTASHKSKAYVRLSTSLPQKETFYLGRLLCELTDDVNKMPSARLNVLRVQSP